MKIAQDSVVHISYILRDGKGEVLDESVADDSFLYLHGHQNIVPGLEKALDGKAAGDSVKVSLTPDEGYGDFDPELVRKVPKSKFPPKLRSPEIGQLLQIQDDDSEGWKVWRVDSVDATHITIDGNHELAGQDLHFEVSVHEVRPATATELEHGHAHAPGHHHH